MISPTHWTCRTPTRRGRRRGRASTTQFACAWFEQFPTQSWMWRWKGRDLPSRVPYTLLLAQPRNHAYNKKNIPGFVPTQPTHTPTSPSLQLHTNSKKPDHSRPEGIQEPAEAERRDEHEHDELHDHRTEGEHHQVVLQCHERQSKPLSTFQCGARRSREER